MIAEMSALLVDAKIGRFKQLLQQDHLRPGIGRLMHELRGTINVRFDVPGTRHLCGSDCYLHWRLR